MARKGASSSSVIPAGLQAVTFDYWNTLVYEDRGHLRGRRLQAWAGILEEAGFPVERERLDAVFDASWEKYLEAWTANQQYRAVQAAEDIIEALGFDAPADVRVALLEAFGRAGDKAELHLTDGVGSCLSILNDAGLRRGHV